ncbi:MAG: hypothetical protein HY403_08115 [Elusimicrobia bacterium]|nr:hypothetical protein [Elusimicrobiota bacterium]
MSAHRVRLKLPNGAELEAEGEAEFVRQERAEFVLRQTPSPTGPSPDAPPQREPRVDWNAVAEIKNGGLTLRGKIPSGDKAGKDACLVLLMASDKTLNQPKPTATMVAKWLRASGYPIGRMDRTLQDAIAQGELLPSGSRRARRYELTASGKIRALLLAEQLTAAVLGKSPLIA